VSGVRPTAFSIGEIERGASHADRCRISFGTRLGRRGAAPARHAGSKPTQAIR